MVPVGPDEPLARTVRNQEGANMTHKRQGENYRIAKPLCAVGFDQRRIDESCIGQGRRREFGSESRSDGNRPGRGNHPTGGFNLH